MRGWRSNRKVIYAYYCEYYIQFNVYRRDVLRTVGAVKDGPKVFGDTSELGMLEIVICQEM